MKISTRLLFPALLIWVLLSFCEYNQLPEPEAPDLCGTLRVTYEDQMKSVIDSSCAYSGCHDGAGGIGPFDFTNYEGLSQAFDDIPTRVIELRDDPAQGMPPNSSVFPRSRKDNLTPRELDLFRCWIEEGFPED